MTSPLSGIAIDKRRQLAATLGLFAMLFVAVGAVAATSAATALVKAFVVIALVVAVVFGLMAWGVLHSVRMDLAEQRLDGAIEAAVRARGASMCDCGHEHDPDEMHIIDACAHDGGGADCSHTCESCLLATLRGSAPMTDAHRRPAPGPGSRRPSPLPR